MSDFLTDLLDVLQQHQGTMLGASRQRADTAGAARPRHRRDELLCAQQRTTLQALWAADPMRDRRHEHAAAWPQVEDWFQFLIFRGRRPRTLYPGKTLEQFTPADLIAALNEVPERSRYYYRGVYHQLFEWARKWGRLIDRSPLDEVPPLDAPRRRIKTFSARRRWRRNEEHLCPPRPEWMPCDVYRKLYDLRGRS